MILFILFIIVIIFLFFSMYKICKEFLFIENFVLEKKDYFKDKKPYLWIYWDNIDNNPTPAYIELCYETVVKNCSKSFEIKRLNKDNIKDYIPELKDYEKYLEKLKIAHKVDFYRILLLYKYGGMYMDSDIIVLKDPIEIIDRLYDNEFVGFGCTGNICKYGYGKPSNWILASRPNSIIMKNILDNLIKRLEYMYEKNYYDNIHYHELGKAIIWMELDKLIKNNKYKYHHYPNSIDGTRDKNGKWIFNDNFFSNEDLEYDDPEKMLFVVLYNSEISKNIMNMTKDDLLKLDCNFTKFIKTALKNN
jgi:hypothetical protein